MFALCEGQCAALPDVVLLLAATGWCLWVAATIGWRYMAQIVSILMLFDT